MDSSLVKEKGHLFTRTTLTHSEINSDFSVVLIALIVIVDYKLLEKYKCVKLNIYYFLNIVLH